MNVGGYVQDASTEITVYVQPTAPPVDPLLTQRNYQYQTRVGDINADGRQDLYIARTSGGVANNGALEKLIVQQTATAGQYVLVPPNSAQVATASAWPTSSAQIRLEDTNVDGFADVVVRGLAGAISVSGADDLIVYAPGQVFSQTPKGYRKVDAALKKFVGNMLDYQANSRYFAYNAAVTYFNAQFSWSTCGGGPAVSSDPIFIDNTPGCVWVYQFISGYYTDYSQFSGAAVAIAITTDNVTSGQATSATGTNENVDSIQQAIGTAIGGWDYKEVLGESGPHTTDTDYRRLLDIFSAVLGIGRAEAETIDTHDAVPQGPYSGEYIYLGRRSIFWLGDHVAFIHNNDPSGVPSCLTNTVACETVSGFDGGSGQNDKLLYALNYINDQPYLMQKLSTVEKNDTPYTWLWATMKSYGSHYNTHPVEYEFNCPQPQQYNSSSFAHGLLYSVQATTPQYDMNKLWPCGSKPVPTLLFTQ